MASTPFTSAFDQIVEEQLKRWHIPGVAFSVVYNDLTWSKGYGLADVEANIAVDPSSILFYAASTTKAQLAAAWAIYMSSDANKSKSKDQQISWTTPLAQIIPDDFVLSDPIRTIQVTLEDCLSHRTGLLRHDAIYGFEGRKTLREVTRSLRNLPITLELRTTFEYCNTPFIAASHALEVLTGKPLSQFLRENLWQPLGMDHTYGGYPEASRSGNTIAKPYSWSKLPSDPDWEQSQLVEEPLLDLSIVAGAGYIISTAEDYAKWMRVYLQPTTGLLGKEIIKELWKPRNIVPYDEEGEEILEGIQTYALGWFIGTYKSHMVYFHAGGFIGGGGLVVLVPSLNFGVTFFSNGLECATKLECLSYELINAIIGVSGHDMLEKSGRGIIKRYKKAEDSYAGAYGRLFPTAPPVPTVPHALALGKYVGSYRHEAYGRVTVQLGGSDSNNSSAHLVIKIFDRTWRRVLIFTHINGEHWLVTQYTLATAEVETGRSPLKTAFKAQTRVGIDGTAVRSVPL